MRLASVRLLFTALTIALCLPLVASLAHAQDSDEEFALRFHKRQKTQQKTQAATPAPAPVVAPGAPLNVPAPLSAQAQELRAAIQHMSRAEFSDLTVLNQFYAQRNYEPAFVADLRLTPLAYELREAVQVQLPTHGLHAADYWHVDQEDIIFTGSVNWLQAELTLAKVLVRTAVHVSVGRLSPDSIAYDIKYVRRTFAAYNELRDATTGGGIAIGWDRMAPQHVEYARLRQMLAKFRNIEQQGGFISLQPTSVTLRVGVTNAAVLALKQRALLMGYAISRLDTVFDEELSQVVRDIQETNLAVITGKLSPGDSASWEFFTVNSTRRLQQIEANMEKRRWLPTVLEQRYIFINVARQELHVVDPNVTNPHLISMRTINGRPDRKTPSMRDNVSYVVLNPQWVVPSGKILAEDKLPLLRDFSHHTEDPSKLNNWFNDNHFSLVSKDFKNPIDPWTVNWDAIDASSADFFIVQAPNYMNALGVAKVSLDNPYSIYLHDTNTREKFDDSLRMLSSGCIRMQYPLDMVEYLLEGSSVTRPMIDAEVAVPLQLDAKEHDIPVPRANKLPVYILSVTADMKDDGIMRFTRDLYGQNVKILNALTAAGYNR